MEEGHPAISYYVVCLSAQRHMLEDDDEENIDKIRVEFLSKIILCPRLNLEIISSKWFSTARIIRSHILRNANERTDERSQARERSKQCGASKWMSDASKWPSSNVAILRCSGPYYKTAKPSTPTLP